MVWKIQSRSPVAGVVAADIALHVGAAARVAAGAVGGTDDDDVAGHHRRRVQADLARHGIDGLVGLLLQIDHAVRPELRHRPARGGVQSNQPVARG